MSGIILADLVPNIPHIELCITFMTIGMCGSTHTQH